MFLDDYLAQTTERVQYWIWYWNDDYSQLWRGLEGECPSQIIFTISAHSASAL